MKKVVAAVLFSVLAALPLTVSAGEQEPTIYVIRKGDTMWDLSKRFFKDPYYWPNLWARNPDVANPHFIYPGQKLKIFPDRVETVPEAPKAVAEAPKPEAPNAQEKKDLDDTIQELTYMVAGGEGFFLEDGVKPSGFIVATDRDRTMLAENDFVYTDIGRRDGAKEGDRFSIFLKTDPVSHPVTNATVGRKVVPLGTLRLVGVTDDSSKGIITSNYREIGRGAFLLPYRDPRREVPLKKPSLDLTGYIIDTLRGNRMIGEGEVVYVDRGKKDGLQVGNMLYVVRDVVPAAVGDKRPKNLPVQLLGAAVVVDTGEKTATALIVKIADTIYPGDRVEMTQNR